MSDGELTRPVKARLYVTDLTWIEQQGWPISEIMREAVAHYVRIHCMQNAR